MTTLLIRQGRVLDPSTGEDRVRDLWVLDRRIAPAGYSAPAADETIEAAGLLVMPGLVDVHVHLREPGNEQAETIESGCAAALAGGFTTIACMPNTTPALDSAEMIRAVTAKAAALRGPRVCAMGAVTLGRQGKQLAPLEEMAAAGAVGFTDDGSGIQDEAVIREALRRCGALGLRLAEHCEVAALCEGGVMHRGAASERAGLPGIPSQAESAMVERDLILAERLRCPVHFQHISAAESVDLIRRARARGVDVTAEVTPHHLALTDEEAALGGPNFKMNPPLRSERDRQALIQGLVEGVLSIIATDHAPHTADAKAKGFLKAPFGVIGLETALSVVWSTLVSPGRLTPLQLVDRMSTAPARAFKLSAGTLQPGVPADVTLFDPNHAWVAEPERFLSRSRNTPFAGRRLSGRTVAILVGGEVRRHAALR